VNRLIHSTPIAAVRPAALPCPCSFDWCYFKAVDTDVKVVESDVPTTVTAPMTTAINAAINPYSNRRRAGFVVEQLQE
jgi:hypothetical protein